MASFEPSRAWVLPEEPVPVRLMSTIWADSDGLHDDLTEPADLDAWLQAVGMTVASACANEADLEKAVAMRDSARRLAGYVTDDGRPIATSFAASRSVREAVGRLNELAALKAGPRLIDRDGRLGLVADAAVPPIRAALAAVAESTIELLGGENASMLRACHAPGCVLYFVKSHPRRQWCSVACGNRVRAARHYDKIRADRKP